MYCRGAITALEPGYSCYKFICYKCSVVMPRFQTNKLDVDDSSPAVCFTVGWRHFGGSVPKTRHRAATIGKAEQETHQEM